MPRTKERSILKEALKKSEEEASVEIVFVSGPSGTGKSTLVSDTLTSNNSSSDRGYHATAKFEKQPTVPFAALRQVLTSLITTAITENPACCPAIRKNLTNHQLKTLAGFLAFSKTCLLNEEEKIHVEMYCQKVCTYVEDIHKDGLPVLVSTLRAAFRALANTAPLILCLEEMQWADALTLDLLHTMLACEELTNVCFIGTFVDNIDDEEQEDGGDTNEKGDTNENDNINRNDNNDQTNAFLNWKERVEKNTIHSVQTMQLDELDLSTVEELLADATNLEISNVKDLAENIYHFTHGNLFAMKELLTTLQDEGLLTFDFGNYKWTWDLHEIKRRSSLSDNVVHSLTARIHKLPPSTQDVLKLASCFGSSFDVRALAIAKSALQIDCVYKCLERACREEFVIQLTETQYKFSHDMIQMVAYGLLPESIDSQQLHWNIGCLLLEHGGDLLQQQQEEEAILFATVDHLNRGMLVGDTNIDISMRTRVAELNYRAGTIAAGLSAFAPAANYLKTAIDALGEAPFDHHYDLAMKLFPLFAKTEYVIGNIDTSEDAAKNAMTHAQTWEEKEASILVLISCYTAEQRLPELVEGCLAVLNEVGERLPANPSAVQTHFEFTRIRLRLKKLSDEQILNLPLISDRRKEIVSKIMSLMVLPLYQLERLSLSTVITCRMLKIVLDYGLSPIAAEALALFGSHLVTQFSDIKEGHRFGNLGLQLLKTQGGSKTNNHVCIFIANHTKWWLEPVASSLDVLIEGNKLAMKSGDVGAAFQASVAYGVNYYYSGLSLDPLLQDVENFSKQYIQYDHQLYFFLISPLYQCLLNLTGRSDNPASMEEGEIIAKRKSMSNPQNFGQQSIWSFAMQLSYYFDDLEKATEYAEKVSHVHTGFMQSSFFVQSRSFFFALIAVANYRKNHKRKDKSTALKYMKQYRNFAKAGAINLVHKLQLLEAELSSCSGKDLDKTFAKYEEAVVSASRAGFLQDAALANYLCLRFILRNNYHLHMAELYAKKSLELWVDWGAVAVAKAIIRRHPDILTDDSVEMMKDGSQRDSYRSKERFDPSLSLQHQQLKI